MPQRTPRPHNLAHTQPIRASYPEKNVTLPPHPFPALPHPTPRTPRLFPATVPILPTNPPQSLKFANPIETHAHTCYPRSREEPTPRPGIPTPKRGKAPGIRRGVPCGCPVAVKTRLSDPAPSPCPPLPRGATFVSRQPAPALQIRAGPATPSATRRTECRRNGQPSFPRKNVTPAKAGAGTQGRAGTTVLGAPSNLKQALPRRYRCGQGDLDIGLAHQGHRSRTVAQ